LGGIGKELEWKNIDSYRRKGSLLIQTPYLSHRDRGRGKTEDFTFYIVLLIEKSI
jgi:hypothetical protein